MDDLLNNLTACLRNQEAAMGDALKRLVLIQHGPDLSQPAPGYSSLA